jgi:drug/metabolite transporter (DMT)-like permease
MIPLLCSILASTSIFVIFKIFPKYKIDTFQAIVFNYITAFFSGIALFGGTFNSSSLAHGNWVILCFIASILFISLFLVMGISSQKNGVAQTSIAVKMSMALSVLLILFIFNNTEESISTSLVIGFILAVAGVFLSSYQKKSTNDNNNATWMLVVLFMGSSFLDLLLKYVESTESQNINPGLFSAFGLGFAGLIGLLIFFILLKKGKMKFAFRNVWAGIILGIPNYFSIYLLILSYSSTGWNGSAVLAITNVSVVLLTSIIGFSLYREKITPLKIIGLIAAIGAISLIYYANNPKN